MFKSIVNSLASTTQLDQDFAAIETINALTKNDIPLAKTKSERLYSNSRSKLISSVIAKSSIEILDRNIHAATDYLARLVNRRNAPAEAYIKLAKLYMSNNKHDMADRALRLGINKIGRDFRFLPTLVHLNKATGNSLAAEENTIKCKKYDADITTSFAQKVIGGTSSSYYSKCAAVLGYDVIAIRKKSKSRAQGANTINLEYILKGLFK